MHHVAHAERRRDDDRDDQADQREQRRAGRADQRAQDLGEVLADRTTGSVTRDAIVRCDQMDERREREYAERRADRDHRRQRLIAIERTVIEDARLSGRVAEIDVRFDADIAAVTRDKEGNVIAGTLSDAIPTHDVWTFRRDLKSQDPNWMLVETDHAA